MIMRQDAAQQLKRQIERDHPELVCELQQAEQAWLVIVTNPRTNEQFSVTNARDWQQRLDVMEGGQGYPRMDERER